MAKLSPKFAITAGSFKAASDNAVGGPVTIIVDRNMDVPADSLDLHLMDRSGISPGDDVTVELGHDDDKEKVFTGSVAEITPRVGQPRTAVRVRAVGTMDKLLNLRKASTYEGQSAGDIVNDLIGAAGLSAGTVSDGPTLPRFAVDQRASAYVHAKGLADRLGYELYTDREGKIMFQALGSAASLDSSGGGLLGAAVGAAVSAASSLLGLGGGAEGYAFGKHLITVAGTKRIDALGSVKVGGESPMSSQGDSTAHWLTKNDSDYQGSAGDGEPHRLFFDGAARTKDLADRFAKGRLAVSKRTSHQVWLTVFGRPSIELGDSITVSDVPDQAATGKGYIRAIRHVFSGTHGFLTTITIAREGDA